MTSQSTLIPIHAQVPNEPISWSNFKNDRERRARETMKRVAELIAQRSEGAIKQCPAGKRTTHKP